MDKKYGYLVLEKGWEYNDEYYTNNGSFEAPEEIYLEKAQANIALNKKELAAFRSSDLSGYMEDINDYLEEGVDYEQVYEYMKETFNSNITEYEFEIPQKATDAEIEGLLELITLRFFTLQKIKIK